MIMNWKIFVKANYGERVERTTSRTPRHGDHTDDDEDHRRLVALALADLRNGKPTSLAITKKEAAQLSGYSVRTIERAMAEGELRATGRRGKRKMIFLRFDEFMRWLGGSD
jgi:CRP-like cAMP-binding protein